MERVVGAGTSFKITSQIVFSNLTLIVFKCALKICILKTTNRSVNIVFSVYNFEICMMLFTRRRDCLISVISILPFVHLLQMRCAPKSKNCPQSRNYTEA
jgi:hypothetical protein